MVLDVVKPRVVIIVQARLGSVRMPRKVLETLGDRPAIQVMLERAAKATSAEEVVLAIPDLAQDDQLEELCGQLGVRCVRGSENDVLARYLEAARTVNATVVVRLTGDCPFIDPGIIDRVVAPVLTGDADWASTGATFPDGLDVQVATFSALEQAAAEATEFHDREHVFPWLHRRGAFRGVFVEHERDLGAMRITLDEPDDLVVLRDILVQLGDTEISLETLGRLWDERPEIFNANRRFARDEGSSLGAGQKLWRHALRRIPGGSMLLSKRAEMLLPGGWPAYFDRASGCEVWDLDGNSFLDLGLMGVGTNILGFAHPRVDEAVQRAVAKGVLSTLNAPEEVELADRLCELHPWAQMARFTRSGGEACAVAVRIGRAATGKDAVAFCGYHGWHDWYLAANLADDAALDGHLLPGLEPAGVPRALKGTARPFLYNDLEGLAALLNVGDVGTVIMEVERSTKPAPGFLAGVRELTRQYGAVLIFDECTSGFRQTLGGHHLVHGVHPDIAVFGKTLGNGYAVNAIIGREAVMEAANRTFISSTFWTERIGSVAALATLRVMQDEDAPARVHAVGGAVQREWARLGSQSGLNLRVAGLPAVSSFSIQGRDGGVIKAFVTREMMREGFLAGPNFYASTAHTPEILDSYFEKLSPVLCHIAERSDDDLEKELTNGPAWLGFGRLN